MTSLEDAIGHAAQSAALTPKEKAAGRHMLRTAIGMGTQLGELRLSEEERADGRAVLQDAILMGVPAAASIERSFFSRLASFFRLPAVAMGLVLSTGLAVAANNSLPGDSLYPMKISVLEPVIGTLQPTSSLRAAWSVEVLNRRLWEIDELNSRAAGDDNFARLEAARIEVRAQAERVFSRSQGLSAGDGENLRRQAKRVLQEGADSVRRAIDNEADEPRRVPLQVLLTALEDNGRTFDESSSSSSAIAIGTSSSSDESRPAILRPLPGGVGVPDPAVISITIDGDEPASESSSSSAESSSVAPSTNSSSRASSIPSRPPVLPAEPAVPPPPVRVPTEPAASSDSSVSLSVPSVQLPAGPLGL